MLTRQTKMVNMVNFTKHQHVYIVIVSMLSKNVAQSTAIPSKSKQLLLWVSVQLFMDLLWGVFLLFYLIFDSVVIYWKPGE